MKNQTKQSTKNNTRHFHSLILAAKINHPKAHTSLTKIKTNRNTKTDFCCFCGKMTEFSEHFNNTTKHQMDDISSETGGGLSLSHQYCVDHKPKLMNGNWNVQYRTAKRSQPQFEIELARIIRQSNNRCITCAQSGDRLIDQYFFHYMHTATIQSDNPAELRNLARRMVDTKLSDNKKRMLVLKKAGFSQTEIAKRLTGRKKQPLTRQAVSRFLASIRKEFLI